MKNEQEEELIKKFLSNTESLNELKNSSEEEINTIMEYGINKINKKTIQEFGQEFIEQLEQHHLMESRLISKIIKKIEITDEDNS